MQGQMLDCFTVPESLVTVSQLTKNPMSEFHKALTKIVGLLSRGREGTGKVNNARPDA